jgi:hypothetical protein
MDATNGQWGIWVSNGDSVLTLEQLSLTAGKTYNFTMDMKVFGGTEVGGFKVDFFPSGSTDDIRIPTIGDGSTWETYTYPVAIPAGTTAVKAGSTVGTKFDSRIRQRRRGRRLRYPAALRP